MKKRFLAALLTVLMFVYLFPTVAFAARWGVDDGYYDTTWYTKHSTAANFEIDTAAELAGLAKLVNDGNNFSGKTVKLTADIELNDTSGYANWGTSAPANTWTPIGISNTNQFAGTFDGKGHTVTGMYINISSTTNTYVGLFGYSNGRIQNLGITQSFVKVTGNIGVGGVAGLNNANGTIENCYNTGSVVADVAESVNDASVSAGGVVGENLSTIQNCYNTGSVSATASGTNQAYAGGVVGYNEGTIANSYNTGSVSTTSNEDAYAGGVAGINGLNNTNSTIQNCYNTGSVSMTATVGSYAYSYAYVGGVAGDNHGTIQNCYNTGSVSMTATVGSYAYSYAYVGGVAGDNHGTIQNCYNTGSVSATATVGSYAYVGGVVGLNQSTLEKCFFLKDNNINSSLSVIGHGNGTVTNSGTIAGPEATETITYEGNGPVPDTLLNTLQGWVDEQTSSDYLDWIRDENKSVNGGYPYFDNFTYNTPAIRTVNGVTASITYDLTSPSASATDVTATVTLSGTATAAGTHTINLNSRTANLTGTEQHISVTAGQKSFAMLLTYEFTVPKENVDDLELTHTFVPTLPNPAITDPMQAKKISVRVGNTAMLSVAATDATDYQWYVDRNDGNGWQAITGVNAVRYITSAVTMANNGFQYYCRVSNASGSSDSPIFTLKVTDPSTPSTGDSAMPGLWIGIVVLSAVGLAASMVLAKKNRKA